MVRATLLGLFAAAGLGLTSQSASAQMFAPPAYVQPGGVIQSSYYTPSVGVVTPGVVVSPTYSGWYGGYRPYVNTTYYRGGYYPRYGYGYGTYYPRYGYRGFGWRRW